MTYSYSDILTAQRCMKKFEYAAVRKLQRKARAVNLTLGSLFHNLMMARFLQWDDEQIDAIYQEAMKYRLDDEIVSVGDLMDQADDMIERYFAHWDDDWEILHVEETFTATVDGVEISFTPDLIIRDNTGVWIVDHKTASSLPTGELPVGDLQAFLYSAVVREIYPDFRGFIFNKIRKKIPTQPRLTKTGETRVADIGRIDTTFELLRDFILAEAPHLMDDPTHQRRLAELKDNDRFFWREYVIVTPEQADQILTETVFMTGQIDRAIAEQVFPRTFLPYSGAQACEKCPFRELCIAELRGYDTTRVMDLYEERDMSHRNYAHDIEEVL